MMKKRIPDFVVAAILSGIFVLYSPKATQFLTSCQGNDKSQTILYIIFLAVYGLIYMLYGYARDYYSLLRKKPKAVLNRQKFPDKKDLEGIDSPDRLREIIYDLYALHRDS
jgi:hypothetical protein